MMFNFDCSVKEFIVHSVKDPALDPEKGDDDEYRLTLDPKHLVVLPGQKLSEFVLRPVTVEQKIELTSFAISSTDADFKKSFEYSVRALEMVLVRVDGKPVKTREDIMKLGVDLIFELSGHAMEVGQLPLAILQRFAGSQ